MPKEHVGCSTVLMPENLSPGKTTDKPEDGMLPKKAADDGETDCEPLNDFSTTFYDSEDEEDELYNPEDNSADDEDVKKTGGCFVQTSG